MFSIAEVDSFLQLQNSSLDIFNEDTFNGVPALILETEYFILALLPIGEELRIEFEDYGSNYTAGFTLLEEEDLIDLPQELASALTWISHQVHKSTRLELQTVVIDALLDMGFIADEEYSID